jgi:signal recognition particle subunit SRP72
VPSLPTGWALGGLEGVKKAASVKEAKKEKVKGKPRHKLPKGAVAGKPFNEDVRVFHALSSRRADQRHLVHPSPDIFVLHRSSQPDRWLPLRQRSSHIAAMGKKKGAKMGMGTGMTQGSTTAAAASSGAGGGGGSKNKKGKKK